jgi:hypothetical protein
MAYADGQCDKEPVFSWEDFIDPISGDRAPTKGKELDYA